MNVTLTEQLTNLSTKQRAILELRLQKLRGVDARRSPEEIVRQPRNGGHFPLSFAQQRLWFLHQLDPASPAYNLPFGVRLGGRLDVAAVRRSLGEIVRRHESLRTVFPTLVGQAVQVVLPDHRPSLPVVDLSGLPAAVAAAATSSCARREAWRPFDLARGPLLRAILLRLGEAEHVALFTLHHIIGDDWSTSALVRELSTLYGAFARSELSPLAELPVQYVDFAVWQRQRLEAVLDSQLAYWRRQLAGNLPVLQLPTDRPRSAVRTSRSASGSLLLRGRLGAAARALGQRRGLTLFMTLLAAFKALLLRLTEQRDLIVGTPIANRNHTQLEGLIGFFANTLVVRTDLSGDPTVNELLDRVGEVTLAAFAHQDLPFERLVEELRPERDLRHVPLFQVMFMVQTVPMGPLALPGLTVSGLTLGSHTAKFDLLVWLSELPQGLSCGYEYRSELFDAASVHRVAAHFGTLLEGMVEDPSRCLSSLQLLNAAERHQLLFEWNDTKTPYPNGIAIHELFEAQVERVPELPAVIFEGRVWSYRELDDRANRLAHHLGTLGAGPGTLVAVYMERCAEMVAAVMGILKTGAAYVPFEPSHPKTRVEWLLSALDIEHLVTGGSRLAAVDSLAGVPRLRHVICLDDPVVSEGCRGGERALWTPANLAAQSARRPVPRATADDLAYIIFTSGSTGTPKGVMVRHQPVVNLIHWLNRRFAIGSSEQILFVTSLCFDLSVYDIFGILAAGGAVRVASEDEVKDPESLVRVLREEPITFWDSAPAALLQLVPFFPTIGARGEPSRLRRVFLSGDWIPLPLPGQVREAFPGCAVVSLGGATEATVWSNFYPVSGIDSFWLSIPYGRPISNARYQVFDEHLAPQPVNVPGDLYIGGDCLFSGYSGDAELNALKNVPDPWSRQPGARLYRTGDRARYLADGNIEFLGRLDHQVKIRGFRIELGEIEVVLAQHPAVGAAVVVPRHDGGERRLVAYIVHAESSSPTALELRQFLRERLPDYMVPAAFVTLPAFPVTANGKLDRAALPAPDQLRPDLGRTYVEPRTPVEERLARIWTQLLGVDPIGIDDNFFELGGDSILSIQVVTRARQEGLQLNPRDVFEHQTIAELAAVASLVEGTEAEQGTVTGMVPLTPIQRWLLDQELPDIHHFNQSLLLQARRRLAAAPLERAVCEMLGHHDALRSRFFRHGCTWRQWVEPLAGAVPLAAIDLSALAEERQAGVVTAAASRLQESLDLAAGPLLRFALFDLGAGPPQRLLIVVHHLVVDGVSWRILLADLWTAYQRKEEGLAVALPPKTTSFQRWAVDLTGAAGSAEVELEAEYWLAAARGSATPVPIDLEGANTVASARTVSIALDALETRALLHDTPQAYRTRINDLLLAALTRAFVGWTGCRTLLLDLEGHGREEVCEGHDVARTVGWFTAMFPVLLELDGEWPGAALKSIKEQLRSVPRHGIGYGMLRYLRDDEIGTRLAGLPRPQVVFNYLGQLDQALAADVPFAAAPESAGASRSPRQLRSHLLEIGAEVSGGSLRVSWTYSASLHRRSSVERLAQSFVAALRELIAHCCSPAAFGFTPSDFPLAGLDQGTLDRLVAGDRSIEDIFPLSPLQEGLLFHSVDAASSDVYLQQLSCGMRGELDRSAFSEAWRQVIHRHPALRTSFVWEQVDRPLQVVHRGVPLPIEEQDLRELPPEQRRRRVAAYRQESSRRPLPPSAAPLIRLGLLRLGDNEHYLVWTLHHLVLDGWSVALLVQEVFRAYDALRRGERVELANPLPFRDYIAWLGGQPLTEAEAYWRGVLAGFSAPTAISIVPSGRELPVTEGPVDRAALSAIPQSATDELRSWGQRYRLTLATLVQGLWALLLSRYSCHEDVVFGAVSAGRPAALRGIEGMVGMFINTLPVRVHAGRERPLVAWLQQLQLLQAEARQYDYSPLAQVQAWSEIPRGLPLFDSLVIFENYPVAETIGKLGGGLELAEADFVERTTYPLTLLSSPGRELPLRLLYDIRRFDAVSVQRLLGHFLTLVHSALAGPQRRLAELEMLTSADKAQLLVEWNDTGGGRPAAHTLHQLFEAQVERSPSSVALVDGDVRLTYCELDLRANRLAWHLRSLGAGPGTLVGVCLRRRHRLVEVLLGVLKSGGAYVPLDPEYPRDRLAFMLQDSCASLLLTEQPLLGATPTGRAQVISLDGLELGCWPEERVDGGAGAGDLAYVIYTSGSTGTPKGVALEHGSAVAFLSWAAGAFTPAELDGVLASTSVCFDLSFFELFVPLSCGGRVILAEHAFALPELPSAHQVTLVNTVPSAMAELVRIGGVPDSVRTVNLAGEPLQSALVQRLYQRTRVGRVLDLYGPSEDTTYSTFALAERGRTAPPTIGRPIDGTRVYLLGPDLRPVPAGVPGELCLAGAGLARGYLGHPELTAERFVPCPFGGESGARLYRTGDLARYLPDGSIDFLGRRDHQVKVRGFRIEPGEIEAVLQLHPAVAETVVVARDDTSGQKRLLAYIVAAAGVTPTTSDLRRFLGDRLPAYMIPTAFVPLPALPRMPNGKLDRRALPDPDGARPELERPFEEPRTETERLLAAIWHDLLRVERVGVQDGFLELGGDSILAIQVASRARRLGLQISPRQVFEHPTLAALAAAARAGSPLATDEGTVAGEVPLTPIQRWYLFAEPPAPHHFNQAVLLLVQETLPLDLLERALAACLAYHDALRLRFERGESGWRQFHAEAGSAAPVTSFDLGDLPAERRSAALEELAGRLQESLDLSRGPLLRAALFAMGEREPARLLLLAHHLTVDGVSWRILLEDLENVCRQLRRGEPPAFPPKTASFKHWAEGLLARAASPVLDEEAGSWLALAAAAAAAPPPLLPAADGGERAAAARSLSVALASEETRALLELAPRMLGCQIDELLLAALTEACGRTMGSRRLLIAVEGHGREEIGAENLDVSRTIGWFTALFPVLLDLDGVDGTAEMVAAVRDRLRAVPGHGLGYGLLRYLRDDEVARVLAAAPQPQVLFNYLGQLDRVLVAGSPFAPAPERPGQDRSPEQPMRYALEVNAFVAGSRLQANWTYAPRRCRRGEVERLAESFVAVLGKIAQRCLAPHDDGSAAALIAAGLTPKQRREVLAALAAAGGRPGVEAVYPLTAVQQGMVYETLAAPGSGIHVEQWSCALRGDLDLPCFERAWQCLVERHTALRTCFIWKDIESPLQVVVARAGVAIEHRDWRSSSPAEQERAQAAYLAEDAARGFELSRPPLMRLALVRTSEEAYRLIWSHHHALLDGWCRPLVLSEAMEVYGAMLAGREPQLAPTRPFGDYLNWLGERDFAKADDHWRRWLAGFRRPTPLGRKAEVEPVPGEDRHGRITVRLETSQAEALQAVARRHRLTLNTLVQAAWGLLLSRYSGEADVLFGITVSGRPADLPGIETTVGLFINTLPLRLAVKPERLLLPWFEEVLAANLELREYEFTPAGKVRELSEVPASLPLYESILVFENFLPMAAAGPSAPPLAVDAVASTGVRTNYPLALIVLPGAELELQLVFDAHRLRRRDAPVVLAHLKALLVRFAAGLDGELSDLLALVPAAEIPLVACRSGEGAASPSAAVRSATEDLLAGIWADVLGLERIGIDASFFDLGGHSLIATQLVSRVGQAFGVQIPVHVIFEAPTVALMAQRIEAAAAAERGLASPPIVPAPRAGDPPLSYAQQRLWFLEQLDPGKPTLNIPLALRLVGRLDPALLERTLAEVVRRHDVLRASFPTRQGLARQVIAPPRPLALPVVGLDGLPPDAREALLARLIRQEGRRPFDLARGPLWRATLLRLGPEEHALLFSLHHIVSDAWSIGVLVRELAAVHEAFGAGRPSPLPELRIQYADFAHWQRQWLQGDVLAAQLAYWKRRLAGAPPVLELPTDRPRPEMPTHRGRSEEFLLPAELSRGLKTLARRESATLYMVALAAFKVLLRHLTGRSDIVVGTDVANRNRLEIEGLIGFFVNQLVLRTDLAGDPTFSKLIGRVRRTTLDAYAHQDLPFDRLVDVLKPERSLTHAPLFQIKFFFGNVPTTTLQPSGLTLSSIAVDNGTAQIDLTIALAETAQGTIAGWVNYATDLFEASTIATLLATYEKLLALVIARPDARLEELAKLLMTQEGKHRIMQETGHPPRIDTFKSVKPKPVVVPTGAIVRTGFLEPGQRLPLLVEPAMEQVDLADWATANTHLIEQQLLHYGAILFRGFGIDSVAAFERFATIVCPGLFNENGEHPRESVTGNIYTPVFYPKDQKLLAHNENSFNHRWPRKILFCCAQPAAAGGETPIVDSRKVYEQISTELRRRFEQRQVGYTRNYDPEGLGLSWQEVFRTGDRSEVERRCREERLQYEWKEQDRLRTVAVRPAVVRHPVTGERTWFNQAQHWHVSCLAPETRESIRSLFAEQDLPRHCRYGDGTPIEDAAMAEILEVYGRLEVSFHWQQGDVLLVDNLLVAHGRNPFIGERKNLVAMGQMTSFDEVEHRPAEE